MTLTRDNLRKIVETEVARRQAELDAAVRYADETGQRHGDALRRLQAARQNLAAAREALEACEK